MTIEFEPNWEEILNADLGYTPLEENIETLKHVQQQAIVGLYDDERDEAWKAAGQVVSIASNALGDLTDVLKDRDNDNSFHRKWLAMFLKRSNAVLLHGEHSSAIQWCHDNVEGEWELLEWLGFRILVLWDTSDATHFKLRWTE